MKQTWDWHFIFCQKIKIIVLFFAYYISTEYSFAQEQELEKQIPTFRSDYITFELVRNHPFSDSQKQFRGGDISEIYGFRHIMDNKWMLGVQAGFRRFAERTTDEDVTLLTLAEEAMMIYRLYHPVYLTIGPKLLYLAPTKNKKIPPEKQSTYKKEIGLGLAASLQIITYKRFLLSFRIERWRGVNREVFSALETGVGLSYSLK